MFRHLALRVRGFRGGHPDGDSISKGSILNTELSAVNHFRQKNKPLERGFSIWMTLQAILQLR